MTEAKKLWRVGIDVGFGYTKIAWVDEEGVMHTLSFPSVLGRAEQRANVRVGLGGVKRGRRIQTIGYRGETYFVGQGALVESRLFSARQDAERIGSDEERILMLAALAKAGVSDALVVTGLPVFWWDRRRRLVKSWRGEHHVTVNGKEQTITVHEVLPVWQPIGSFYARFLDNRGVAVENGLQKRGFGVVDIGTNTTDFSGLINLRPVARLSGSVRVGVRDALGVISAHIAREYGVNRDVAELAEALEGRGTITVFQDDIPLEELAASACQSLSQQIVSAATGKWGQADRFYLVLITGGGASLVGKALRSVFPRNSETMRRCATANAEGFARYAQRRVFKVDRG
jgi:PRTRC genetic system protein D